MDTIANVPAAEIVGHSAPLVLENGHLFVTLDEGSFLLDTGAPGSFGRTPSLALDNQRFALHAASMGMLNADELSGYVGKTTDGLLGTDILNAFDILLDVRRSRVCFSTTPLECVGDRVPLGFTMNVPTLSAMIDETPSTLFFDTGAQLSYFQGASLSQYPPEGTITDFYPGIGAFSTETFRLPIRLGDAPCNLRFGRLPTVLGMTLMLAGAEGIVGNEVARGRRVGYFPRRSLLVLGAA